MLRYPFTVAAPSEPEGWDAAVILELENPATKRWSCPTMTKRNRRCENVVSQERSIKVTTMINIMSIEDAAVIVRDDNRELTNLAKTMICPLHLGASDSGEKIEGVVALWKNYIKTSIRWQTQHRTVRHAPRAREIPYQPSKASSRLPRQHSSTASERTTTVPEVQMRPRPTVLGTSPAPQSSRHPSPSSHGATFDADTLRHLMGEFSRLTEENQALRDTNQRLRSENARLMREESAAATRHRQTEGAYEAVQDERSVLSDQVDGLYQEINMLRAREDRHLQRITALEDTVQQSSRTYRRLKKVWTAASVAPKEEEG